MKISGLLETLQQMLEKCSLFTSHVSHIFFEVRLFKASRFICRTVELPISSAVNHKIRLVRNPKIQAFPVLPGLFSL